MHKFSSEAFAGLCNRILYLSMAHANSISITGWQRIATNSRIREHTDLYYHDNRKLFKTIYHEPPQPTYFRNYRTEIDYPQDLEMVRAIAKHLFHAAPLTKNHRLLRSKQRYRAYQSYLC